jgi:hypothetical protein
MKKIYTIPLKLVMKLNKNSEFPIDMCPRFQVKNDASY